MSNDKNNVLGVNYKKIGAYLIICLGLVIVFQLVWGTVDKSVMKEYNSMESAEIAATIGYEIDGNRYITSSADSQLYINCSEEINFIEVNFAIELEKNISIQVFYCKEGEGFSEENSIVVEVDTEQKSVWIDLPLEFYSSIRVDIGSSTGIEFELDDILMGNFNPSTKEIICSILFQMNTLLLYLLSIVVFFTIVKIKQIKHVIEVVVMQLYRILKKNITTKKIIIMASLIFIILVALGVNVSHMEQYMMVIPNNIEEVGAVTIGTSRGIRSDEWFGLSYIFNSYLDGSFLGESIFEALVVLAEPTNWGFVFLPLSNAFAFYKLLPYLYGLVFAFFFFDILLPNKKLLSIIGSFLICFAPESAWWWGPDTVAPIMALIVCFYYFFEARTVKLKVLCSLLLAIFLPYLVVDVYPAWDVPLVYFALAIVICIFYKNKKLKIVKTDWIYIVLVLAWVSFILLCYWVTQQDSLDAIMNTVYPGTRFIQGGDLDIEYLYHYMIMWLTPFKDVTQLNNSEISAYVGLYPIPIFIFILNYKELIKNKVIVGLQILSVIFFAYMFIGFPAWLAKISLMSYSSEARTFTIFGLISTVLILLQGYELSKVKYSCKISGKEEIIKLILINLAVLVFMIYGYTAQVYAVEFLGTFGYVAVAIGVLILANLMQLGYYKVFLGIFVTYTLVSSIFVNPINIGVGIMTETELALEIQKVDEEGSGNWIVTSGTILPKYVNAQGVNCLNSLSYPPKFELFYPIDEGKIYEDIYNRYAHVVVEIVEDIDSSFELLQTDCIRVNLSEYDLDEWAVDYIVSYAEVEIDNEEVFTTLLYYDELDGVNIYRVNYK